MKASELITALALPLECRVDQRVPKKLLVENGAPTTSDKRLLTNAIEEIQWIAALKPNTVGVPDYRDEKRQYLEVAVLSITTRGSQGAVNGELATPAAKPVNTARLAELVHRAVPYPVLLLLTTPQGLVLSMAQKRWAQNEDGKVVLDGDIVIIDTAGDLPLIQAFKQSMELARQPQATLMAIYEGWLDCLTALKAAHHTGQLTVIRDPIRAAARRAALRTCQRLEQEAVRLRFQASKEKQMAKQVALNLTLTRVQAELAAAREQL